MKNYIHCLQKKDNWCVPACLESILKTRNFTTNQKDIAIELEISENGLVDINLLNNLLIKYDLTLKFKNPFLIMIESDMILNSELNENNDVLVAYNYQKLHNLENKNIKKHFSIITDYNTLSDEISMLDPSQTDKIIVDLISLHNSIQAREDKRYGFYIIY